MTIDRERGETVMIASAEGGIEIEEVARVSPEKIARVGINPLLGLRDFQIRNLAAEIEIPRNHWRSFISICQNLYEAYQELDATLAEINPLVITTDQRIIALDGKIIVDDNALFRHTDLMDKRDIQRSARRNRSSQIWPGYIKLDGNIGCLVNGAGLAMASMDIIKHKDGLPANFLDIGGGASAEKSLPPCGSSSLTPR